MTKVKTFVCGLASGVGGALAKLDEFVEELGSVEIVSVHDCLYPKIDGGKTAYDCEQLARRVIYKIGAKK